MGIKNGTNAYKMVYGNHPFFVNIFDDKQLMIHNSIDLIDLPTIIITACTSFAKTCVSNNSYNHNIGQLILFRDRKTGTVISILRDRNCVISLDDYPLKNVDDYNLPSGILNYKDQLFYKDSYFKIASKIQKTYKDSYITIIPINFPSNQEINYYRGATDMGEILGFNDNNNDNNDDKSIDNSYSKACEKINKTFIAKEKYIKNKKIMFMTHEEIINYGRGDEWNRKCIWLLENFEGMFLFIAQDIIRRIFDILPKKDTKKSIRYIFLLNDGKPHPIKEREKNIRKEIRYRNIGCNNSNNSDYCLNHMRYFLCNMPHCILIHYLLNILRIPLTCRLNANTIFYSKTSLSEAETTMVHFAGYLCNLNIPYITTFNNKEMSNLDTDPLLKSKNEKDTIINRTRYLSYTWIRLREIVKCYEPFMVNLYSTDSDVLHKWNLCAGHSMTVNGDFKLPFYIIGVRFYRTMTRNQPRIWLPNVDNKSPFMKSTDRVYQMCYELSVTHIPHDIDAGMLLMILCGSDYNDPGMTFGDSLKLVYREVIQFKRFACTCYRGWQDYALLCSKNNIVPFYRISKENSTTCRFCYKQIIRQFWEIKKFFAAFACLSMNELDPDFFLFNDQYEDNSVDSDNSMIHKKIALNCVCNVCTFLIVGKYNKQIFGSIKTDNLMIESLKREIGKNTDVKKDQYLLNLISLITFLNKYNEVDYETHTDGGIKIWDDSDTKLSPKDIYNINYDKNLFYRKEKKGNFSSDLNKNNDIECLNKRPRVDVVDIELCNNNYKILSFNDNKNKEFWKCFVDTVFLSGGAPIAAINLNDFQKSNKLNIDITNCLEDSHPSVKKKNIITTIINRLHDETDLKVSKRKEPDSNISAINRFIDLILTIYYYIIGEDTNSDCKRVPIEHKTGQNRRTAITIQDFIFESLSLLYSQKIIKLNPKESPLITSLNNKNEYYKDFNSAYIKFCSIMINNKIEKREIGNIKDKNQNDTFKTDNDENIDKYTSTNNIDDNNIGNEGSPFPYVPILGEARHIPPLTIWLIYLILDKFVLE
uniref:Wsv139-like protein n=1 Tax=Trachysalambria curvirostris majanivirus TaxID=2984281 RepID=A0A9C7BIH4_9VIRU|nr:MAG: wsv139-like protein [Trachysalambria curvirostris majanivirus]